MMTGLLLLAILGVASAGNLGRHGHGQEFTSDPSSLYNAPGGPGGQPGHGGQPVRTQTVRTNGVFVLDGHACIIRGGELTVTGTLPLAIGSESVFEIGAGFGSTVEAGRIQISDGLIHVRALSPNDVHGITRALAQSGTTLDQFIQQTGTVSPPQAILEITAGIVAVGGVYININVGVFILLGPATGPVVGPATGPTFSPATGQEFTVTETAVHVTQTIRQPVTLTKTRTVDRYTTITSPVYNNVAATITNFVKETVAVPENQVIRSPLPGRVVVNTVPVVTQVVLTVTDTSIQFFVQTALDTVTSTLHHLAPNFNFRTVTINNPQTSTVVQTITRTNVATVYVTNTVGRTIYSTATVVFTVTESINTPGGY